MKKLFCSVNNSFISKIDKGVFCLLEKSLIELGEDSDKDSFDIIREKLKNPPVLNSTDFAKEVIYVILASGFKQKIAKQKFFQISKFLEEGGQVIPDNLLVFFKNKNKINAICKIWNNKDFYRNQFYSLDLDDEKLSFLSTLPYIGEITKNHIARNLGINKVKYDVWIQRLGIALYGDDSCSVKSPVDDKVIKICDKMFDLCSKDTGLPVGYIDVILWKSCQVGLLKFID